MLDFTLLGALCMVGTLWLVVYARSSTRAGALAIAVLAVYAWSLLSMLTTLVGTTLLSFRLQPTLTVLLTAAGALGFVETTRRDRRQVHPAGRGQRVVAAGATLGAIGAMTFIQDIPDVLRPDIVVAYTDTDGSGQRADRRPPGAESYYREIDAKIGQVTGRPRHDTVVMTADYSFLAYYPYYGFQGLTSHYANPLAQFTERSAAIEGWATITEPDQFIAALDDAALDAADRLPDATRRERHLHAAPGQRRLPEPAQRPALSGGTGRCAVRRSAVGRVRRRALRPGDPEVSRRDR